MLLFLSPSSFDFLINLAQGGETERKRAGTLGTKFPKFLSYLFHSRRCHQRPLTRIADETLYPEGDSESTYGIIIIVTRAYYDAHYDVYLKSVLLCDADGNLPYLLFFFHFVKCHRCDARMLSLSLPPSVSLSRALAYADITRTNN